MEEVHKELPNNSVLLNTRVTDQEVRQKQEPRALDSLLGVYERQFGHSKMLEVAADRYGSMIGQHETPVSSSLLFQVDCAFSKALQAPDPSRY